MTHDHDEGRLAPECAYKDGYIRGRHEKEAMVTVASVLDAMEGRNGRTQWKRVREGSRWPRFLLWPEGSSRAWPGLKRWSSPAELCSLSWAPRPPRATGCGHGGGSAGGSRAAGTVTVGALAGAKADESRSVVSQHGRRPLAPLYGRTRLGRRVYLVGRVISCAAGGVTGATVDAGVGVPGGNVPAGTDLGRGVGGGATTVVDIRVDDPPYEVRAGQADDLCFLRDRPRPGGRVLEKTTRVSSSTWPQRVSRPSVMAPPPAGWALGPTPSVTGWCTPPGPHTPPKAARDTLS